MDDHKQESIVTTFRQLVDVAVPKLIAALQQCEFGTVSVYHSVMPERRAVVAHVDVQPVPQEQVIEKLEKAVRPHYRSDDTPYTPRLNGLIQVKGPMANQAKEAALEVNLLKRRFGDELKDAFPKMHHRERFLKNNFESLCTRSVHRQLLIGGSDVMKTTFHWSECNLKGTKLSDAQACRPILAYSCDPDKVQSLIEIIEQRMSHSDRYQLVHITEVRVHPVQYVKYAKGDSYRRQAYRSGLPLLVFGEQLLAPCTLEPFVLGAERKRQNNGQRYDYVEILPEYGIYQRALTDQEMEEKGGSAC